MTIAAEGAVTKADFDGMEARLNTRPEMLAAKIDARFAVVDERFKRVDERFNTFDEKLRATQDRLTVRRLWPLVGAAVLAGVGMLGGAVYSLAGLIVRVHG